MRLFLWFVVVGAWPLLLCAAPTQDLPKAPADKLEKNSPALNARLKNLYWVDFGVGFPQLPSIELAVQPLKRWQLGASYGILPGGSGGVVSPKYVLPSQNVTLSTGLHLTVHEPTVSISFSSLCPFLRYFPNTTGFYLQFTLAMLKASNTLSAELHDVSGNQIPGAKASGTVDVTQYLPTLSIGHIFNSRLFYFSVNMGLSAVANMTIDTHFESYLPDSVGGSAANQTAIDQINEKNKEAASKASDEFRQVISFLPSLQFVFGLTF